MQVNELMSHYAKHCRPDETLAGAARLMWDYDCGAIPVVDDELHVVGMISDRDICMAAMHGGRPLHEMHVVDAMSRSLVHCRAWDPIEEALEAMAVARVRRLPVVDAAGRLTGIISLADLAVAAERARGFFPPVRLKDVAHLLASISEPSHARPADALGSPEAAYAE
jgi:CBS domain-containing protein